MGRGMSNQLANIFGPRIDFKRLQPGDHFNLIYQGQSLNNATILAAEFNNRGNAYQAVRYTDSLGHSEYYDPKGQNFQATTGLLRYPVAFSRISSYFSYKRYDPVLHRVHSHPGLDLAAPRGTPIKSIGEGRVDFVGRRGGYGNAVVVSYGRNYSALFGHMSRFSSGLRRNSTVHQGQVIGYVGSTGFATGPHVHFEVHVNGVPRDPLKVTPPPARSIDTKDRLRFLQQAKSLMAELQLYQRTELAANASGDRKIN